MNNVVSTDRPPIPEEPDFPEDESGRRRRLDYLGYAPCPIRTQMRQRLRQVFAGAAGPGGAEPAWYMPGSCHAPNVYDELWRTSDAVELPGLISEVGFGDFNRPEFVRRWLDSGGFAPIDAADVRPEFRAAGLVDPRGYHRVYGANVEILLIDLKRLGSRPVPRTWADILDPRFRGDVIVSGEDGDIHESILFGLHQDQGDAGLEALGANVVRFMHPAEMAKAAGTAQPQGAAVYVLPWFFARGNPHREATRIVWPEEGAFLSPLYLLRRQDARPAAHRALEYLLGEDFARFLAKLGLAPARAGSPPLPGPLRWVGWDFVRHHDIETERARYNAAFVAGRRTGGA
jgi:ABC-type Fe3+ transport system substrate-binding protein